MVNFSQAKPGKKWALTEYGLEQPRIRAKFKEGTTEAKRYERSVPYSWVLKGYVEEVDRR